MTTGIDLITAERQRQIDVEGYTPEKDKVYNDDALAKAAACYALPVRYRRVVPSGSPNFGMCPDLWPWDWRFWKPAKKIPDSGYWNPTTAAERIRELTKAGALIAAEIDRLSTLDFNDNHG